MSMNDGCDDDGRSVIIELKVRVDRGANQQDVADQIAKMVESVEAVRTVVKCRAIAWSR